jgi:CBS domain containing-hemolysin-like protein
VRAAADRSGHLRILVRDVDGAPTRVVHVRDVLLEPDDKPVAHIARPASTLTPATPLHTALASMRETRNHLAVVPDERGGYAVVTLADVPARIFPRTSVHAT